MLISYENEAILARQSGEDFDYIVPDATLKIENPAAVLQGRRPEGQGLPRLRAHRRRPGGVRDQGLPPGRRRAPRSATVEGANDPAKPFPTPAKLFTIDDDLGGWDAVNTKFFDEKSGIVPQIQQATGKAQ